MTGQSKLKGAVLRFMLAGRGQGFFVVVVVVHTPTVEGLFRVVSQFNVTARILNVLHANKEICLIL